MTCGIYDDKFFGIDVTWLYSHELIRIKLSQTAKNNNLKAFEGVSEGSKSRLKALSFEAQKDVKVGFKE